MKTFEYRLFPNKEQQHLLMQCLVRTHICTSCGHTADRDVNAAKNILTAGGTTSPVDISQQAMRRMRSSSVYSWRVSR